MVPLYFDMKIRQPELPDRPEIDRIHHAYFKANEYPKCLFVVADDDDKLVVAGGVKTIAEFAVVSDQARSVKVRQEALLHALGAAILIANDMKFKQLHAFVDANSSFVNHLKRYGFKLIDAKVLVLDLGDSNGKATDSTTTGTTTD